ncbi:hypothetical protein B0T10DRAFT_463006 [Thelonectria olida]|uniref:Uncharacterized protein n=1 Tax=Thelonectria olida TaxID=1576542 RepID=A0A9P9AIK4_9HYPO|nr:hypothetical protein B0T10DRAFT_463006 [Thelonectria olida]
MSAQPIFALVCRLSGWRAPPTPPSTPPAAPTGQPVDQLPVNPEVPSLSRRAPPFPDNPQLLAPAHMEEGMAAGREAASGGPRRLGDGAAQLGAPGEPRLEAAVYADWRGTIFIFVVAVAILIPAVEIILKRIS